MLKCSLAGLANLYFCTINFLFIQDFNIAALANRAYTPSMCR
jgi:hypothetical protein